MTTIGELEKQAGITDRNEFWGREQFKHITGTIHVGNRECDARFEATVAELRRLAAQRRESA